MILTFLPVLLLLFPFLCFSSKSNSEELSPRKFRETLEQSFYLEIEELVEYSDAFAPLANIPSSINSTFLGGKILQEQIFNDIYHYVDDCLNLYGIDDELSGKLLLFLKSVCETSKKTFIDTRNCILEKNIKAIKVLTDVCYLFKTPIKRLVLTTVAYGCGEMFKDAPILLENLRQIFFSKTDPLLYFDFNEKLNFIRTSFDYYFSQRKPDVESETEHLLVLYKTLKTEIMAYIDDIINGIKSNPEPLDMYSTGLGNDAISMNLNVFDSEYSSSNQDLWKFIMDKVSETHSTIESECPDLKRFHVLSLTEAINMDLLHLSGSERRMFGSNYPNAKPFTVQAAYASIKKSSKNYFAKVKQSSEFSQDFNDQIEKAGYILSDALLQFNKELSAKIHEIAKQYQLSPEDTIKYDFSVVGVSELAKDKAKCADLETYL